MTHFINVLSNPNDTILDPFLEVGVLVLLQKRNGRNFIGIEINEGYFKSASKRIAEVKE